jgi:hypothetical protein
MFCKLRGSVADLLESSQVAARVHPGDAIAAVQLVRIVKFQNFLRDYDRLSRCAPASTRSTPNNRDFFIWIFLSTPSHSLSQARNRAKLRDSAVEYPALG